MVGSPNIDWHGMDKVKTLAKAIPDFDFHIVGIKNQDNDVRNLTYHGICTPSQLAELYQSMDIGLGTLALHRKGMNEACPLKCREYAAFGLPFIIGYKDNDFSGQNFVLEIENTENNVVENIERIKKFVNDWKGKRVPYSSIEKLISVITKEKQRLDFFTNVLAIFSNNEKINT
jgi:hypothetical protein